ncbi:MAG: hypothetical protein ACP5GH_02645 [Nitrososphaeria archaeon]
MLTLYSLLRSKRTLYISYNEPQESLVKKAQLACGDCYKNLTVYRALSGSIENVYSEMLNALKDGMAVALDSVDAFLATSGLKTERSLLQLIYESTKINRGRLLLIYEGINKEGESIKFLADAYLKLDTTYILGLPVRRINVIKDRDYPTSIYPFYYTLRGRFEMITTNPIFDLSELFTKKVKPWNRPSGEKSVMRRYEMFHYVLDSSVNVTFEKLYRLWLAVDYLYHGRAPVIIARPEESPDDLSNTFAKMSGGKEARVVELTGMPLSDAKIIISNANDNGVVVFDPLIWEKEAIKQPELTESAPAK